MKGLLVFLLCLAAFVAGGWVAGPWLVDRAVDRFVERLSTDPKLAAQVVAALVHNPGFHQAVGQQLKGSNVSQTINDLVEQAKKRLSGIAEPGTVEKAQREIGQRLRDAFPSSSPAPAVSP